MMPMEHPTISEDREKYESLYTDLVETSQDLIWQCDAEGRYIYLNPAWETILGYRSEEMIGRHFYEFQPPEEATRSCQEFFRLMSGEMVKGYETVHLSKSGKRLYLVFNAKAVFDRDGTVIGTRGTAYDITERKIIELELAENEARFRAIIEHAPFGAHQYELRPGDRLVFTGANAAADAILKVANAQFIGKTIEEAFPNLAATDIPQAYRSVARNGQSFTKEQIIYSDDRGISGAYELSAFQTGIGKMAVLFRDITEKKRAEEALRVSEERFRMLFDTMVHGVVFENAKGEITSANTAAEKILGITIDQMRGLTSMDPRWKAIREDGSDFPGDEHPLPVALRTGKPVVDVEHGIFHPEKNSYIWIKVTAVPMFRPGETTPYQAYATFEDITDRRRAEEGLRVSESRLSSFINSAVDSIYLFDANLNLLKINSHGLEIIGRQHEKVIGINLYDLFPYMKKGGYRDQFFEVIHSGNPFFFQHTFQHPHFGTLHFNINSFKVGDCLGIIAHDITVRVNAEEKLREQEQKFRSLIENSTDIVTLLDAQGHVLYNSPSYYRIMGFPPESRVGESTFDLIHPDDRETIARLFKLILEKPDRVALPPCRVEHQNGSWIWVEGIANNLLDMPFVNAIVVNYRDITEHKRTEETLQKTQKLESLGLLAGGIAHDFNNLLSGMFGYVDMAKASIDENRLLMAREALVKAFGVFDRTKALTRQLLTFAKGGAPVCSPVDLAPLVSTSVQFALSGSNVVAGIDIAKDLYQCDCDENQIGQVIDNIVLNAQQAMPLGGKILISARNVSIGRDEAGDGLHEGDFIRISIEDYGIGIPDEHLPKIFDPFFSTKAMGHGLGLTTVYSIVKRHGGWVDVESVMGKRTTFHIYLPASSVAAGPCAIPENHLHHGAGRVLVMDDEAFNRDTVSGMIRSMGYEVVTASDGSEALALYVTEHQSGKDFVFTVLDLTIPDGMGGKETATEIRRIDEHAIIVLASGYADDPVMEHPAKYGFTATIAKPYRKSELAGLLDRIFITAP